MAAILIIDDYPNIDFLYRMYVGEAGHRILIARSAEEAINIAIGEKIDLVVADQFVEGLDPEDLMAILKLLRPKIQGILSMVRSLALNPRTSLWDHAIYKGPDYFPKLMQMIQQSLCNDNFCYSCSTVFSNGLVGGGIHESISCKERSVTGKPMRVGQDILDITEAREH